jgi:hypothetical protein
MEGKDPKDLINQAEEQKYSVADDSLEVFSWFSDNSGEMFSASKVVEAISEDFGWDSHRVRKAITGLVDDSLDPVQQVVVNGNTHIGIIEYKEFQDFGGYGFIEYDDTLGQRKNLVCAKCVSEKEYASEPFRAVEGYGRHPEGCSYNHLLEHLEQHYDDSHSEKPSDIEVGASLVSGTTISSNTAIHGGNQSNFSVTDFAVGVLGDGELLSNSGGTLTGSSVSTDIDLLETQSVPDINNISKPTIAYVNSINDYIAAFGNVIPDSVVDDFESGDLAVENSNWNDWGGPDVGNFAADANAIVGNFSGYWDHPGNGTDFIVLTDRTSAAALSAWSFRYRRAAVSGSVGDTIALRSGGSNVVSVAFRDSGDIQVPSGGSTVGSWSGGTDYLFYATTIDYANDEFDYEITDKDAGTTVASGTVAFQNAASQVDDIYFISDSQSGDADKDVYIDEIRVSN